MLRQDWQIHRGVTAVLGIVDNTSFITSTNTTEIQEALSVDPKFLCVCLWLALQTLTFFNFSGPAQWSERHTKLPCFVLTYKTTLINVLCSILPAILFPVHHKFRHHSLAQILGSYPVDLKISK
jgi:hypothetical protein